MSGERRRVETEAVHAGERRPGPSGSVVFPIFQGTVYTQPKGTPYDELAYIRLNTTPSQEYLQDKLARLEGAEACLATASGMAAVTTALLANLKSGDHLIAGDCLYGGTHHFLAHTVGRLGWSVSFVDMNDPDAWAAVLRPETRLFLCETITNPLMRVARLDAVAGFARQHGLVSLIDNTFASPVNFRPLEHGFDLVFHSATKYLNGHSDVVAGCVMGSSQRLKLIRSALNLYGASLDPHPGFLLARGLKTLALRVAAANANALALARALSGHPGVAAVNHPGLDTHPDHEHAARLLDGFGGMLSFRITHGYDVDAFLGRLAIATVAPSLGGVETLVTLPSRTSHAGLSAEERQAMGVTGDLVRVSCGIEAAEDLIADLSGALEAARPATVTGAGATSHAG
jgi:cystathionine gamma-synthase/cystathionine gamma-lyase/cystathionine beta-lyase